MTITEPGDDAAAKHLMHTPKEFCESLPWTIPILWEGRSGVHAVDEERRFTLILSTRAPGETVFKNHYVGFEVILASKRTGQINWHFVTFADYVRMIDGSSIGWADKGIYVYPSSRHGWGWNVVPSGVGDAIAAVEGWMNAWR